MGVKFFAALFSALALSCLFGAPNMIVNGDFRNGWDGFGFSDGSPEEVGAKLEPNGDGTHTLSYSVKKGAWGGFNLSEVRLDPEKTYMLSFSAKSDKPAKIRLMAFANGDSIYRHVLGTFDLGPRWTTVSQRINTKNGNFAEWVPFRIECEAAEDAVLTLAAFKLAEAGETVEDPLFISKVVVKPSDGKNSGKKSRAPAANSMIFRKNSQIAALATFFNGQGKKKKVMLSWKISAVSGDKTYSGEKRLDVPPGRSEFEIGIKAPPKNGLYSVRFEIDGNDAGASAFAVTPVVRAPKGTLPIDIGYCGVITNGEFAKPAPSEMEFLAGSGISYIRTWDNGNPYNWRVIEPEEGRYDFSVGDATLELAKKSGLEILPVLGGMFFIYPDRVYWREHRQADWLYAKSERVATIPNLAAQGRYAVKPPIEDWERMVRTVAERYKGKIRQYEIMNEPNIIWDDKSVYFPYLVSAYKILKSVDPQITVVGLSTTGDFGGNINGFVDTMLKMGAGKYIDAVSFHSYGSIYEDSKRRGDDVIMEFKRDMEKFGVKVPLWNSELYYLNPESTSGDAANGKAGPIYHAGYLVRRYLVDIECGVSVSTPVPATAAAFLYPVGGQDYTRFADGRKMPHASVQDTAFVPSEKYIASAVFARQLSNARYAGRVMLRDGWICYRFENKKTKKAVGAIFALGAKMENLDLRANPRTRRADPMGRPPLDFSRFAADAKFIDVFGNEIEASDGALKLEASPIPVYIKTDDLNSLNAMLNVYAE